MNHKEIAQSLKACEENIILIYAFNSTGKTRLSIAYKDETKRGDRSNTGVYYNAFSEDLFVWDNDSDNEGENVRLTIQKSIFNQFHSSLTEDLISQNLIAYLPKYRFRFNLHKNTEEGIESISFFPKEEQESSTQNSEVDISGIEEFRQIEIDKTEEAELPIKISRGEERIFVWCFILALFEVEEFFANQSDFIFIDDPVSSLDEHNIFITSTIIIELFKNHFQYRKLLITTHHAGLYSILNDWLKKGDQKEKFKGKYQSLILRRALTGGLEFVKDNKDTFLYHLKLLQLLNEAKSKNSVSPYHFALLRQLLENVSSFLGKGYFSYVLQKIDIDDVSHVADRVNALSHKKFYSEVSSLINSDDQRIFNEILEKLNAKFDFSFN